MKKFLFASAALAFLFFVSCTKTTTAPTPTNPNPIEGLWVGTYQVVDAAYTGSFYYAFNIFADSTAIVQGGGTSGTIWTAKGTWTLAKDSLLTIHTVNTDLTQPTITQTITSVYDSTAGTLSNGLAVYTSGGISSSTFSLKRIK